MDLKKIIEPFVVKDHLIIDWVRAFVFKNKSFHETAAFSVAVEALMLDVLLALQKYYPLSGDNIKEIWELSLTRSGSVRAALVRLRFRRAAVSLQCHSGTLLSLWVFAGGPSLGLF